MNSAGSPERRASSELTGARVLNVMLAAGRGGLQTMARRYHQVLADSGARVTSVGHPRSWFARAFPDPDDFIPLQARTHLDPLAQLMFRRLAKRFDPDLVIVHGRRSLAAAGSRVGRARLVTVAHNAWFEAPAGSADLILAVSASIAEKVRTRFPETRCALVENFGPLRAAPLRPLRSPPVIAALGRLDVDKGFDVLLKALSHVRDRGCEVRLRLAGEGREGPALRRLAHGLGLERSVEFLPWVEDPIALLAEADLFVCSSRVEPFGLVVIEAMAAGAPVVSTRIGGPCEILEHGRLGLMAAPDDPVDLADAIRRALDDWPSTAERARAAQAAALARYSADAGRARLAAALAPLLGSQTA